MTVPMNVYRTIALRALLPDEFPFNASLCIVVKIAESSRTCISKWVRFTEVSMYRLLNSWLECLLVVLVFRVSCSLLFHHLTSVLTALHYSLVPLCTTNKQQ